MVRSLSNPLWWIFGVTFGGGRDSYAWWRDVRKICERIKMEVGIWFNDNLRRVVGDSVNTFLVGHVGVGGPLVWDLVGYLSCLTTCWRQWQICVSWVGGEGEKFGSGGGDCLHERKIWLGSVVLWFTILFFRLRWSTSDNDFLILLKGIQSTVLIIFL